jgi:hypothetical protein
MLLSYCKILQYQYCRPKEKRSKGGFLMSANTNRIAKMRPILFLIRPDIAFCVKTAKFCILCFRRDLLSSHHIPICYYHVYARK